MSSRSRHHSKSRLYTDKHYRHTNSIGKLKYCENMPSRIYRNLRREQELESVAL